MLLISSKLLSVLPFHFLSASKLRSYSIFTFQLISSHAALRDLSGQDHRLTLDTLLEQEHQGKSVMV